MKTRTARMCQLMALTLLVCCCFSAFASGQDNNEEVTPRFVVIPQKPPAPGTPEPSTSLLTWSGSVGGSPFVMVGNDPSTGPAATIPTYLISVKIVLSGTQGTFDPGSPACGPLTPFINTWRSPIFDITTTYNLPPPVGTTQYVDAFQRANFWNAPLASGYHVLVGTSASYNFPNIICPGLTLNVPAQYGHRGSPFGFPVAEVDINYFDAQISAYMLTLPQIQPNTFPIFITANTYLTSGGCCIGGYHSANGAQTYAMFDYDTHPGVFSQDVSALSHEVGEWMDDPLTNGGNNTPCGLLEVGDPLEGGSPGHPYGTYTYVLNNFTYHLQDLVFLRYFGGPANGSVNSWWSFQNFGFTTICQNGS